MSFFQLRAVVICLIINMLDGFDILVIAFVAPEVAGQWGLSPEVLGVLFSAGLAGMTVGSLLLSPLADVYGRRPAILVSLIVTSVGMVVSAFTGSVTELAVARFVTGLGIGTMIASLATIVAEYSSDRWRATAISFSMAGYPIGAIFGGIVTVYLLEAYGWQAVFLFGGVVTSLMIPLAWVFLPESIEHLLTRREPDTLTKINGVLAKMHKPQLEGLPELAGDPAPVTNRVRELFAPVFRKQTAVVWACFFLTMASLYFAQTWTPKIMVDAGFVVSEGVSIGVFIQVGALLGVVVIGVLTAKLSIYATAALLMSFGFVAMVAFSLTLLQIEYLYALAVCIGLGVNAAVIALYAIVADLYPADIRSTAVGWAIGGGALQRHTRASHCRLRAGFGGRAGNAVHGLRSADVARSWLRVGGSSCHTSMTGGRSRQTGSSRCRSPDSRRRSDRRLAPLPGG